MTATVDARRRARAPDPHRERVEEIAKFEWRCGECDCSSFARVDEPNDVMTGGFRPGPLVRCVNCKAVSYWPAELGEVERLKAELDEARAAELVHSEDAVIAENAREAAERARDELQAEVERWKEAAKAGLQAIGAHDAFAAALSAKLSDAEKALEPFGRAAEAMQPPWSEYIGRDGRRAKVEPEDYYRAREVLYQLKGEMP